MMEDLARKMDEGFARMGEQMESRFAQMDQAMESRFAQVDQKMESRFAQVDQNMESRFAQVDQRFEKLEGALNAQGVLLERNTDDIRQLAEKIDTMEASFDRKMDEFRRAIVVERLEPLEEVVREHSRRLDGLR